MAIILDKPKSNNAWQIPTFATLAAVFFLSTVLLLTERYVPNFFPTTSESQIIHLIENQFIGEYPSEEDLQNAKYKSYLMALNDDYSVYFTPEEAKSFIDDINQEYVGIGISFDWNDGLQITDIFKNSPAEKSGLEIGDIIIKVDETDIRKLQNWEEITNLIKGEIGTKLTLTLSTQKKVELTRERVILENLTLSKKDNFGVLQLSSFGEDLDDLTKNIAEKILNDSEIKYLVLDLRGNGGGELNSSIDFLSYFLPEKTLVMKEQTKTDSFEYYTKSKDFSLKDYPLIILVDENTASASEIVALALSETKSTKIVGMITFGKGVVQDLYELSNGGFVKITTAKWLSPSGKSIDKTGIIPDIIETDEEKIWQKIYQEFGLK